jgi:preprotein translocase subunit SecE
MTTRTATAKPSGNRVTRFFSGIWGEMKKVVWLSRREAAYLTFLVLIVTIIVGVILGVFDYGFSTGIGKLLLGG